MVRSSISEHLDRGRLTHLNRVLAIKAITRSRKTSFGRSTPERRDRCGKINRPTHRCDDSTSLAIFLLCSASSTTAPHPVLLTRPTHRTLDTGEHSHLEGHPSSAARALGTTSLFAPILSCVPMFPGFGEFGSVRSRSRMDKSEICMQVEGSSQSLAPLRALFLSRFRGGRSCPIAARSWWWVESGGGNVHSNYMKLQR